MLEAHKQNIFLAAFLNYLLLGPMNLVAGLMAGHHKVETCINGLAGSWGRHAGQMGTVIGYLIRRLQLDQGLYGY